MYEKNKGPRGSASFPAPIHLTLTHRVPFSVRHYGDWLLTTPINKMLYF